MLRANTFNNKDNQVGKLKTDQTGFSAVEVVLVLVIIALVGAVGFTVAKNHNKTPNTASATKTTTPTTTKTTAPDAYAGWQTYTATLEPVSFKYPKDWTVATGSEAPINQPDNQLITLNAPQRVIDGVNYQFSFTFQVHTPTSSERALGHASFPVYSSTKLTNTHFPKTLYALILEGNAPAGSYGAGLSYSVEISATNFPAGGNTDGNDTIPTSTAGRTIDLGGTYEKLSDHSLAYFPPSEFASLQEVQQSKQVFSSLTQH